MTRPAYDAVWINGSVGAGKTTAVDQLGEALEKRGIPGAMIDVDGLRRAWPSPPDDPFQFELTLANSTSLTATDLAEQIADRLTNWSRGGTFRDPLPGSLGG